MLVYCKVHHVVVHLEGGEGGEGGEGAGGWRVACIMSLWTWHCQHTCARAVTIFARATHVSMWARASCWSACSKVDSWPCPSALCCCYSRCRRLTIEIQYPPSLCTCVAASACDTHSCAHRSRACSARCCICQTSLYHNFLSLCCFL